MSTLSPERGLVHGEVIFSEEEVNAAIGRVALEILSRYDGTNPLFVSMLRGAGPFTADLMSSITREDKTYHPELDYMIVSTYGDEKTAREPRIVMDLAPNTKVKGRQVILLDDILDTGATSNFTTGHLEAAGAEWVDTVFLVNRLIPKDVQPDIAALETSRTEWLIGKGMDDAALAPEGGRWLPYVAVALHQPEDD